MGKPKQTVKRRFFRSWRLWVLLSIVSLVFPTAAIMRFVLGGATSDTYSIVLLVEAGIIGLTAQIYYYARFVYGKPQVLGGIFDPTGTGAPVWVQLSGTAESMSLLSVLDVPLLNPQVSDQVLMLDETEEYHIVGVPEKSDIKAVKVDKAVVSAILYHDYLQKET